MGYIANSNAYLGPGETGATTIQVTLPVACSAGDVVLAVVCGDNTYTIDSVTSSNISWSRVLDFNHPGNDQNFSLFRGKVTSGFSASTEVITGNYAGVTLWRYLDVVAYTPTSGKTFATEPVQQSGHDTYGSGANPTGADGYSKALTTTGSGSFFIVGLMAVEDFTSNSNDDCDPGTGMTLRGAVHSMFNGAGNSCFPFLWMDKEQASSGTTTVYGQHVQVSTSGSSLVAVALEMTPDVPTGTSGGLVVGSETSYVGEGFVGSIEAAGSISSAISLTLTPSGTLTGTGAVSAAVSLTLTSSGTLAGTGALSSAIPITFTAAGALSAVGVLSSTIPLALTSSGAIAGTGAVSSTIPLALTPSGTLTGTGAVSAAVSLTLTPSGALAGLGALASDIPLVVSLGGTLENAGSDQLTGSVGVTLILSATLTGQGALSSAIPITLAPSATLTGTGALASAVPLTVSAASVLTGTGQLVTTMPLALTPSGTLGTVGSGALTSTVGLSLAITATLAGSGALTGTVPLTIAATGTMRNGAPYDLVGAIGLTLGTQGALTGRGALTSAVPLVVSLTADIAVQITGAHPDRIVDVTRDSRTVRVARTARGIDVTRDSRLIN